MQKEINYDKIIRDEVCRYKSEGVDVIVLTTGSRPGYTTVIFKTGFTVDKDGNIHRDD